VSVISGLNCYIVSYDIMDRKRLYRVHTAMKGFGEPVHYSVFRCDLTPKGRVEMVAALTDLIKADEDRIMIIDMGPAEGEVEGKIEFLGVHREDKDEKFIIV
jgi:CRISPR-associated protein Cas2